MVLVDGFTVHEAAEALGVGRSRVQAMIDAGDMPAELNGNRWLIPRYAVYDAKRMRRPRGRPLASANAWSILDQIEEGHRPGRWLAGQWPQLQTRAKRIVGRMLPSLEATLVSDRRCVFGGAQAAAEHGAPVRSTAPFDVYVSKGDRFDLESALAFRAITTEPNLTIHVVSDMEWFRFDDYDGFVPLTVAYVDLLEAGDRAATEVEMMLKHGGKW